MAESDSSRGGTQTRSVSEVAHQINDLLGTDPALRDIRVTGEVADLRFAASGHHFFRLRDTEAALSCVLFRFSPGAMHLEDGAQVVCSGRANLYVNRGDLQIVVSRVETAGLGALQARLDELRRKLAAEGLFEESRKREPPRFPQRIAVITAESGSVWQDILNVLRRRYPLAEVLLLPVTVQGVAAVGEIQRAFESLDAAQAIAPIDVAILARGGGSLEDLMPFNDEAVARAIFACRIPVISGVGHETDTTISDLVADRRAPTPSAAAELVSPDQLELRAGLAATVNVLRRTLTHALQTARERHEQTTDRLHQSSTYAMTRSRERLHSVAQRLGALRPDPISRLRDVQHARRRIGASVERLTEIRAERLNGLTAQLRALSHINTMRRGFAIVRDEQNKVLKFATQVKVGVKFKLQLSDGTVYATPSNVELNDE